MLQFYNSSAFQCFRSLKQEQLLLLLDTSVFDLISLTVPNAAIYLCSLKLLKPDISNLVSHRRFPIKNGS
jgi:hypothetical protein